MWPARPPRLEPQSTGTIGHLRRNPPKRSAWGPTICPGLLTAEPSAPTAAREGPAGVLPVLMSFPHHASLVLKAKEEGRDAAISVLQLAMLRLLTSVPAGKIRFTIIDPTGLGQNFSAFMHLADYDERLVGHRIWTETAHINQRLVDLTEHMENVIQKYLRNQFDSIQQYNAKAGEVAEPFRVLVVANFPTHFSEEATRRLISIANSGPRCGVYTLMSIDLAARPPRNLQWSDLEANANVLVWEQGRFHWQSEPLSPLTLHLDSTPADQLMTTIIQAAGRHAQQSSRVEVPFSFVAPDAPQQWRSDSSHGDRRPPGTGRSDPPVSVETRPGDIAACVDCRQDRFGKIDAAPRADHECRVALCARSAAAVPGRLQERVSSSSRTRNTGCHTPA